MVYLRRALGIADSQSNEELPKKLPKSYIPIKWSPNLSTIDVLFLIPCPWITPVWVLVKMPLTTIITISVLLLTPVLSNT